MDSIFNNLTCHTQNLPLLQKNLHDLREDRRKGEEYCDLDSTPEILLGNQLTEGFKILRVGSYQRREIHSTCGTGVLRKRDQTTFLPIFNFIIFLSETKIDSFNRLQNLITGNNHNYCHLQVPFSSSPSDPRAPLSLCAP